MHLGILKKKRQYETQNIFHISNNDHYYGNFEILIDI